MAARSISRLEKASQLLEQRNVVVDACRDTWILNLDGNGHAKRPRAVHLSDARGRSGHRVQVRKLAQAFGTELTLENLSNDGEVDGFGLAVERRENGRGLGRQEIAGVDGQKLPGLHEGTFEAPQALGDEFCLLHPGTHLGQLECVGRSDSRLQLMPEFVAGDARGERQHAP